MVAVSPACCCWLHAVLLRVRCCLDPRHQKRSRAKTMETSFRSSLGVIFRMRCLFAGVMTHCREIVTSQTDRLSR